MKIAYIEDDRDAAEIFLGRFRADGVRCDVYASAEEAAPSIGSGTYDAVVLDIRLPGQSGIDLLKKLRARGIFTPAVVITAFNSLELTKEALNAGASYLLEKPFSYRSLKQIVEKVVAQPQSLQYCVDRGLERLGLTDREDEVARAVLKGLSNAEIARTYSLSEKTVKQYVTQIFAKARVESRAEFFSWIFPV